MMRVSFRNFAVAVAEIVLGLLLCSGGPLNGEVIFLAAPGLSQAKERAAQIRCVNNLLNIRFAARTWSMDNADHFPPDFQTFAPELQDPSVLICPADMSYAAPTNWAALDWTRLSYEWVPLPYGAGETNISCRCKVHNNVAWLEGSVHQLGGYHTGWPELMAGPMTQFVTPGSAAQFQVKVAPDASGPLSFQWRRNTLYYVTNAVSMPDPDNAGQLLWFTNRQPHFLVTPLVGQTNQECVLAAVATNDSDYYNVAVSNSLGTATSAEVAFHVTTEVPAMAKDPTWAQNVCIHNLRQIGLLASFMDRNPWPPNLSEMTNRFGQPLFEWPVALHCPADTNWSPTLDWTGLDLANTSYTVAASEPVNSLAIYCRCKVHGFYVQPDGTVMWRPILAGIQPGAGGNVQVTLRAFAGRPNILESSSDLKTWDRLGDYGSAPGEFVYSETRTGSPRFYRLKLD